jgi:hypothetical protein
MACTLTYTGTATLPLHPAPTSMLLPGDHTMLSALYDVTVAIVQAIKNRDKFAFEVFVMQDT